MPMDPHTPLDIVMADPIGWNLQPHPFKAHAVVLANVSQTVLNDIARLMNGRPRKTLNWKTPDEVLSEDIRKFYKTVALDS